MKDAVEVQLDPEMLRGERTRLLEKTVEKINYLQWRNAEAVYYHDKRTRQELRGLELTCEKFDVVHYGSSAVVLIPCSPPWRKLLHPAGPLSVTGTC